MPSSPTRSDLPTVPALLRVRIVGSGRAGGGLHRALVAAGAAVEAPVHHDDDLGGLAAGCDVLVLAVPDAAVAATAARVEPVDSTLVVHLAGALGPDALAPHARRAALHPIVAFPDAETGAARLAGAWFARTGDAGADALAAALGGRVVEVAAEDRVLHHATCAIAANHLVALTGQVERLAHRLGVPLAAYLGLAEGALANVVELGPAAALTGPVARGDHETVERHVVALPAEERPAYEALAAAAARLVGRPVAPTGAQVEVHDTRAGFRKALDAARSSGRTVGLVPTMGALHEGHASLIRRAAEECDLVAVTIFVNPLQFDRKDDLAAYPRTLEADLEVVAAAGGSVVLHPSVEELYGVEGAAARVHVEGLADRLEGAARPGHFDGVATVVTKLLSLAGTCRAYFGEKDFQQLAVVRRMAADLDLAVEVVGCPTVRADDGLALSSRNALLTPEERTLAPALNRALRTGAVLVDEGERDPAVIEAAVAAELARTPDFRLDRIDVVDAATLAPPTAATTEIRLLIAAFLGRARLIDNLGVNL